MKPCPKCSFANADHAALCASCGQPITDSAVAPKKGDSSLDVTERLTSPSKLRQRLPIDVFVSQAGKPHRSIKIETLFAFKKKLTIGRVPQCDICLPHPSVSREHAVLEKAPEGIRLTDQGSTNGVLLGGRRIDEPIVLREQVRVGIGPFLFCLVGGELHALDNSQSLRLEARRIEKTIRLGNGNQRKLLDNINLCVEPGEFVSLLGPSGSGKSTLMDCLNGRRPATSGKVLANGEDFYYHFDSFRQLLGYVPQKDIVHTLLTVNKALYYTAKLRLPSDTEPAELMARVDEVVKLMELGPHRETLVGNLSGGQIKRVSLGAELLARPALLYIDEATSGLDAGTEARMMRLFRQLSDEGRSVVCITHNVDNVDLCDLILVLTTGKLAFYGPPAEALAYFRAKRISEIYDRLGEKQADDWQRQFAASSLHKDYVEKRLEAARPSPAPTSGGNGSPTPTPALEGPVPTPDQPATVGEQGFLPGKDESERRARNRPHRRLLNQFLVLTARYVELMWRDQRTLRLLLLQAPIVALFFLLGFADKPYRDKIFSVRRLTADERELLTKIDARLAKAQEKQQASGALRALTADPTEVMAMELLLAQLQAANSTVGEARERIQMVLEVKGPIVPDKAMTNPVHTYMLLFVMVIAIFWFGCNNAAREIVKEEAIYARERSVNLGISPYLASKFLVLAVISAMQVFLMMLVLFGSLELSGRLFDMQTPSPEYYLAFPEQFCLLVLLAWSGVALGLVLSACVSSPDRASTLLPYVIIPQIILAGGLLPIRTQPLKGLAMLLAPAYWALRGARTGETEFSKDMPVYADYDDNLWLPTVALTVQTAAMLLLTAWFLKRKDVAREGR